MVELPRYRITCFFVDPGHRREGVSREALHGGSLIRKKSREGDLTDLYVERVLSPVRPATTSRYEARVLQVLVHIEDHLDDPLPLAQLAAVAGFSPHHFHRIFQNVTGEAPKEYLRRLRLERAVARLKVSPDNVLQIALEAGFKTHETFTRAFTRRFGINPSEFRGVLRAYREAVSDAMGSRTFAGFTEETPLTLRFDMQREPVTVERTPPRHLLFVRHYGFENLLAGEEEFLSLWDPLFEYADAHHLDYSAELLVGITHDDPYVTEESKIRFDACLPISGPMHVSHPIGYRFQEAGLCVARRHFGGREEIAKTFAYIGVEWLPSDNYCLRAAAPFELYSCGQTDGRLERICTDAYVPLEPLKGTH
ncbi:MAG: AraC family transcriptional regulator [Chloroflexota bacterium]|nr:AraC family transcriptional regulator [Chloroflexota bacterium]